MSVALRRRITPLVIFPLVAVVAAGLIVVRSRPATATAHVTSSRLAGADRFETAVNIAEAKFPSGVPTVVLASGLTFADALAGSYLAGLGGVAGSGGPAGILLTLPGSLPPSLVAGLAALKVKNVVILGGTSAVSPDVATQLAGMASTSPAGGNLQVTRVAGIDRYETMQLIDTAFGAAAVGSIGGRKTAIVASGANFPDSLAAAGAAYKTHLPIVLTTPDGLSAQAAHTLTALGISQVLVMGGTAAIQSQVNAAVQAMGVTIAQQFSGADRTDTAARFAAYEVANLGFSNNQVVITRGDDFADALTGAQYAGDPKALLELETSSIVGQFDAQYLSDHQAEINAIVGLGGVQAITVVALTNAVSAAEGLAVTAVSPASIPLDGQDHQLTIVGSGFTQGGGTANALIGPSAASGQNPAPGPCVGSSGTLAPTTETTVSDTQLQATFHLPAGCPTGPYSVLVISGAGGGNGYDCVACLTVTPAGGLFVGSIVPSTIPGDGSGHQVTILGSGFVSSSTASVSTSAANTNPGSAGCGTFAVAVTGLILVSPTQLVGSLGIPAGCPTGVWDVVVDNSASGGGFAVCQQCLTVTGSGPAPTTTLPGATTTTSTLPGATTTTTSPTPPSTVQVKVVTTEACTDTGNATPLPGATVEIGTVAVTTAGDGTNSNSFATVVAGSQMLHGVGNVLSFQVTADFGSFGTVHLAGNDQVFDFTANPSPNTNGAPDWVVATRFQMAGC